MIRILKRFLPFVAPPMLAATLQAPADVWELRRAPTAPSGTTPKGLIGKDFKTDLEGAQETGESRAIGQFVVVFEGYPEPEWLEDIRNAGLSVLEPLPPMGYGVYGLRSALDDLAKTKKYIYRVADIPPGARRFGLPDQATGAADSPSSAVVVAVEVMAPFVAGTWRTPGTAWPTGSSLGSNPVQGTYHWGGFLASLRGIGVYPENQTIGFLDTGVDDGLFARGSGAAACPPHLNSANGCKRVFSADTSDDHPCSAHRIRGAP